MPKEKEYTKLIPKIYKRKYEDIGMFFYVEAQLRIFPAMTVEQSIKSYFCFIKVNDYNMESAIMTFSRLRGEYIDLKYNEVTKKNCHTA
jgi:hypothetical protein